MIPRVYVDSRKYWRLRYWVDGKEKSLSLGVFPTISLKEARARRNDNRKLISRSG
ncbi:MAG: Arm DNA-binding domain-containing protein [Rugosibacter sp.]